MKNINSVEPRSVVACMDRIECFFGSSFMVVVVVGDLAPTRELKCGGVGLG